MTEDESRRLAAVFDLQVLDQPPEPEFDDIAALAQRLCGTAGALVSIVAAERQWFLARTGGLVGCETPISQSICAHAIHGGDVLEIRDLRLDPRTRENPLVEGAPHLRFYAGAVLRSRAGLALGTLCVIDLAPRPEGLTPDQRDSLLALARQTVSFLELRRVAAQRDAALAELRVAGLASLDRAQASDSLRKRSQAVEARLRGAQQAAHLGAFEYDLLAGTFFVTAEVCRLFGWPDDAQPRIDQLEAQILDEDRHLVSTAATRGDGSATPEAEYRIRRVSDGAIRWVNRRSSIDRDETGRPFRWIGIVQDVTERKAIEARRIALVTLGDALRDAETTAAVIDSASVILGATLGCSRAGYAMVDVGAGLITVERDWAFPQVDSVVGHHLNTHYERTIERLVEGRPVVIADTMAAPWLGADVESYLLIGTRSVVAVPLLHRGSLVGVMFAHTAAPRDWSTGEVEFVGAVADRTHAAISKVLAEDHQRLLNQELSHRLKNTMAMVQAIANQTLRGVADRSAVRSFEERIIALSNAHDVLLQENWAVASAQAVVDGVLRLQGCDDRVAVSGPDLKFGPKATLSVTLLIHELVTNAIKYGALSNDTGVVDLNWRLDVAGPSSSFAMTWTERGGPPAFKPKRQGFGSRLIAMGIAGAGVAEVDYTSLGVVARFRAPISAVTEA